MNSDPISVYGKEIPLREAKEIMLCLGLIVGGEWGKPRLIDSCATHEDQILFKSIEILIQQGNAKILQRLVGKRGRLEYSGPYDYLGAKSGKRKKLNENYSTWKKCAYGVRVPAIHLDFELRLLVKTLPLLGILTTYSCTGHQQALPRIAVFSSYDVAWTQVVYERYLKKYSHFGWSFSDSSSWRNRGFTMGKETLSKFDENDFFWDAQRIARKIMIPQTMNSIRELRQKMSIKDLLDKGLSNERIL